MERKNWDQITLSNSPRSRGTTSKFGKESPSRGVIQKCEPHERNSCDTRRNHLAKSVSKLKIRRKLRFTLLLKPGPSKSPEERAFVVDSGASMHAEQKDLCSDEMETLRRSRIPTTVVTAIGEVHRNEEAQVYVHDLDLFVTVQILDDTLAVLSLGKLCEEYGYTCEWTSGQKPHPTKQWKRILCKTEYFVPIVVPGLSSSSGASSSSTSPPQDSSSTSSSPATERSDHPAPGNSRDSPKIQRGITIEPRTTVCEIFQLGLRSSQTNSKKQNWMHPHTFLMGQIRNVLQK